VEEEAKNENHLRHSKSARAASSNSLATPQDFAKDFRQRAHLFRLRKILAPILALLWEKRNLSGNLTRLMRPPLDPFPYPRDPRSRRADATLPDGLFALVQDGNGQVWVVPDGPHIHPKVLGGGQLAMYAGDMRVSQGRIEDVTNLSGTFQFDDPAGLLAVADQLIRQGLAIRQGGVRLFPADGSPPQVLR